MGQQLNQYYLRDEFAADNADGSIVIIVATNAPLSDRNLTRLAHRGLTGLARTGSAMSNGSGDYVLAFSTADSVRRIPHATGALHHFHELPNDQVSPLFLAAIEATEEAIYNSLCMAERMVGYQGRVMEALPLGLLATSHRAQ